MTKSFSIFTILLLLLIQNYSFGCNAGSAAAFETCANNNSSGTINVSNNSTYTVMGAVDISNMEVDLNNANITLNPNIIVSSTTTFKGNGSASFVVDGVLFSFNSSPTFQEVNDMLATGSYSTLGQMTSALPVTLIAFKAELIDNGIQLFWQTASEIDNEKFEVQKSQNGYDWQIIGELAGSGTSAEKIDYRFIDDAPAKGLNYFRLKQLDFDGAYEFSQSIVVEFGFDDANFSIFPNPASGVLNIELEEKFDLTAVEIFNQVGKMVYTNLNIETRKIDISDLPNGVYFLSIRSNRTTQTKKFMIE